ncbi:MAG: TrmH family RNA methyltransferase [Leucobacter sp.]
MLLQTIESEDPASTPSQTIDSARHPVARRIADVLRSRSKKPKIFVIDDPENIEQAVACEIRLDSLYVTESAVGAGLPRRTRVGADVPCHILDDAVARILFGGQKHSRVFALAHAPRPARLHDLIGTTGDLIVLDGVRLVGNIGAITRTACALGAAGVVLLNSGLRTPLDRRLIRASRGLVFAKPVILASRAECVALIEREGLPVAALAAGASEPLRSIRTVAERLAFVLGSERRGVSRELESVTTYRYAIPMTPNVESLNVSVAAGIALYEHRTR